MMGIMGYIYFSCLLTPHLPYYQKLESCYHLSENTPFLYLETNVFPI